MKSNNTKFRSLNEAIQSVTNPQPELTQQEYIELLEFALESIAEELECDVEDLLEDIQTPQRKAEGEKDIKKLKGAARKSLDNWAIHRQSPHDRNHTSRGYKLQDKFVAVQKKLDDRTAIQKKEQKSKTRYGVGGKRRKTK